MIKKSNNLRFDYRGCRKEVMNVILQMRKYIVYNVDFVLQ